jgi:hypothetical protein
MTLRRSFLTISLSSLVLLTAMPVHATSQKRGDPGGTTGRKANTASGTVKTVSGTSLTIVSAGKELTFQIDNTTKFVGKGLATKSREKGGKTTALDFIGENDKVSISYYDAGGSMRAAQVRVNSKGTAGKD